MSSRIEQLEHAVAKAKKDFRATLSVSELGRENVKDILNDVKSANRALGLDDDSNLRASTKLLRDELERIQQEAEAADKKRMKELANRAKEISKAAQEVGDEESSRIAQSAGIVAGGLKKASTHISSDTVRGEGIAKTIFGESIGSWMAKPSGTRGSGKKRAAASLKLRMAQADLNSATSSLTPAEVAEQDREDAL